MRRASSCVCTIAITACRSNTSSFPARSGDVWHGLLLGCGAPARAPSMHLSSMVRMIRRQGHRFDAAIALIDPYARELSIVHACMRAKVVDPSFAWARRSAARNALARNA
jgi:hypothetical protein